MRKLIKVVHLQKLYLRQKILDNFAFKKAILLLRGSFKREEFS